MNSEFPAREYRDNVLADCFETAKRYFLEHYLAVDRAHALMLAENGIIRPDELHALLEAIASLDLEAIRRTEYDGSVEDLFFYLQRAIGKRCDDPDAAAKLHTARSRNDIDVTIYRLYLRGRSLALIDACAALRRVFLELAASHVESLMPAYTHTQPAQPTTIAHYLLAMSENLGRDVVRLQRAFDNLNRCPLGACAITTTGFPIDRERVAELLGFDGPTGNSYASIASVDYFTELLGAAAALTINVGRFAQEFLQMAMIEFGVIRLPDGYVQASSIMPQKRNPVALEHVRAIASKSLGQALGVMTAVHNTPFGDINDVEDDLQPLTYTALEDATRAVSLLAAALAAAEFDTERLRRRASANFITVTELADELVRREGLSFGDAHAIVAGAVGAATDAGEDGSIRHDDLQASARQVIGRTLSICESDLETTLSAEHFVRVRSVHGGPAPATVAAALSAEQASKVADDEWLAGVRSRLAERERRMDEAVAAATSGRGSR